VSDLPEALPATLTVPVEAAPAEPIADVPVAAPPPVAAPSPVEAAPVVEAEPMVEAVPAPPVLVVAAKPRAKAAKPQVSEDTLNAWQQRLEQDRAAQRRRQQAVSARAERQQAFRLARRALEQLAQAESAPVDPALAALADDELACAVHAAPERIRTVLAATLRLLQKGR